MSHEQRFVNFDGLYLPEKNDLFLKKPLTFYSPTVNKHSGFLNTYSIKAGFLIFQSFACKKNNQVTCEI